MPNQDYGLPYQTDMSRVRLQMQINELNRKIDNARRWRKHERIAKLEAQVQPLRRQMARLLVGSPLSHGKYD